MNTNKREYHDKEDNISNIKKVKTVTSTDIEWDMIEVCLLEDKKLNELIIISNSIGISTSEYCYYGTDDIDPNNSNKIKQHLINRIKFLVKTNNKTINNQIVRDDNNPFDKTSFQKLVLESGVQGENELLFWKIFKNKSIYKHIMSFMNILPNAIPYEYIVHVEEMINCNQISLLKYKVKRNEYLEFNLTESNWDQLFSTIQKQDDDDTEFYNCLFGNYKSQILQSFKNYQCSSFKPISKLLIKSNCVIGLKVLIDHFNFIPTIEDLQEAQIQCFKVMANSFNSQTILKEYNFNLFKKNPLASSLNDLIETIGILDQISGWGLYENSKFKHPIDQSISVYNQPVEIVRNEIVQFKFSSKQLSSKLRYSINYTSNERNDIKKLLDIYYRVGNNLHAGYFLEYSICYGGGNGDYSFLKNIDNTVTDQVLVRYGFLYSHYPTLKYACPKNGLPNANYDHSIFDHFSTKEQKSQFLKLIIQDKELSESIPDLLFSALVYQDDLELLQSFLISFDTSRITAQGFSSKYIKSVKMMNYLSTEQFELIRSHLKVCENRDINLLNHLENLLNNHGLDFTIGLFNGITVKQFQYIVNNPIKLQTYKRTIFSIKPIDFQDNIQLYYSSLKKAIISNPNITFKVTLFFKDSKYPPNHLIQFLTWLNTYKFQGTSFLQILLRSCENSTLKSKTIQYYLIGGSSKLFKNCDLIGFIDIVKIAITRGDTKTIDKLLNILIKQLKSIANTNTFESSSIKTFIFNIIKATIENNQLLILRHLYCNFNQIFKIQHDKNDIVSKSNIEKLISIAFEKDNIKINKLLFNIYTISKSKYNQTPHKNSNSFIILEKYFID